MIICSQRTKIFFLTGPGCSGPDLSHFSVSAPWPTMRWIGSSKADRGGRDSAAAREDALHKLIFSGHRSRLTNSQSATVPGRGGELRYPQARGCAVWKSGSSRIGAVSHLGLHTQRENETERESSTGAADGHANLIVGSRLSLSREEEAAPRRHGSSPSASSATAT